MISYTSIARLAWNLETRSDRVIVVINPFGKYLQIFRICSGTFSNLQYSFFLSTAPTVTKSEIVLYAMQIYNQLGRGTVSERWEKPNETS